MAENEAITLARDLERLDRELESIAVAQRELAPLLAELAPLADLRAQLAVQDGLAAAESRRQALLERLRGSADEEARLNERAAKLETAPTLEVETQQQLAAARVVLVTADDELERARTLWVRDRQEAETRLEAMRAQYTELVQQRDTPRRAGRREPLSDLRTAAGRVVPHRRRPAVGADRDGAHRRQLLSPAGSSSSPARRSPSSASRSSAARPSTRWRPASGA